MEEVSLDDAIKILNIKMKSRRLSTMAIQEAASACREIKKSRERKDANIDDIKFLKQFIAEIDIPPGAKNRNNPEMKSRRIASRLLDICSGKEVKWMVKWSGKDYHLNNYYNNIVEKILYKINDRYSGNSFTKIRGEARILFSWLQNQGLNSLDNITSNNLVMYLEYRADNSVFTGITSIRWALKKVLSVLEELKYTNSKFDEIFIFHSRPEKRILPPAKMDDVVMILNSLDRSTSIGKRNYAIILLALSLGLRRSDIANLSLTSINWADGKMTVIQQKTGGMMVYPLTTDIAEGIIDYIKNGRPQNYDSDKLFLTETAPHGGISPNGIGAMYRDLVKKVFGEPYEPWVRTMHSLRRLFAKRMIEGGAPLIVASKALGHKSIDPTAHYLSYDTEASSCCALDLTRTYYEES